MSRRLPPHRFRQALRAGLPAHRRGSEPAAGDDVWVFAYDGCGNLVFQGVRQAPHVVGDAFSWTGRDYVTDTNLQYNRVRSCDPTPGLWLNDEPVGYCGDDPNLYRYVGNAPPTPSESE